MKTTIYIPVDGDEQDREISDTYGIATVKGWELAARIYARCEPGKSGPTPNGVRANLAQTRISFAELSRRTERSRTNIRLHWHNWHNAIEQGWAVEIAPGDTAELPSEDYPSTSNGDAYYETLKSGAPTETKVGVIREVMRRDPEVEKRLEDEFVQKAAYDPALHNRIHAAHTEFHPVPDVQVKHSAETLSGFHAGLYLAIQRETRGLQELVEALEREPDRKGACHIAQEEIDGIDEGIALMRQFQDRIRTAVGVDVDATFARLVG